MVWLRWQFRLGPRSSLGRLAQDGAAGALCWLPQGAQILSDDARRRLLRGYAPYVDALHRDATDVAAVAAAFERLRVLAAVCEGGRGVAVLNALAASAAVVASALHAPTRRHSGLLARLAEEIEP